MTSPFTIEGPDDEGNVHLRQVWNTETGKEVHDTLLGPKDQVAETLSQWLGSIDYEERTL